MLARRPTFMEQEQAVMEKEKIPLDIVVDVQKDFIPGPLAKQHTTGKMGNLA